MAVERRQQEFARVRDSAIITGQQDGQRQRRLERQCRHTNRVGYAIHQKPVRVAMSREEFSFAKTLVLVERNV